MQRIKQVKLSLPGLCWGRGGRGNGRFWRKRSDSEVSVELSLEVESLLLRKKPLKGFGFGRGGYDLTCMLGRKVEQGD